MAEVAVVNFPENAVLVKFKVKEGSVVSGGTLLCEYKLVGTNKCCKLKSTLNGTVKELLAKEGDELQPGAALMHIELCRHLTVWRNMCAECGLDLREKKSTSASIAMEHMIPDLLISEKRAEVLGREDEFRLLKNRQLALLVDLDQTLLHTTNDNIPPNLKGAYHFQLWPYPAWYHTKFRPHTESFLEHISQLYELHICTFGTRTYAHTIARYLDPDGRYFSQRILSRDECFHPTLKTSNLKALFPCGDAMVCIIDDREDVWKMAPNLVHVRPYHFFDGTADINAPPEASKTDSDNESEEGVSVKTRTHRNARVVRVPKTPTDGSLTVESSPDSASEPSSVVTSDSGPPDNSISVNSESELSDTATIPPETSADGDSNTLTGVSVTSASSELASSEVVAEMSASGNRCSDSTVASPDTAADDDSERNTSAAGTGTTADTATSDGPSAKPVDVVAEETTPEVEEYEEFVEWEDLDDYLVYLEDVLRRIHTAYYELYDQMQVNDDSNSATPDLKTIVPYVRRKVLKGARIVLSGVCPLGTDPTASRIYRVAESLGAIVQSSVVTGDGVNSVSEATTHVVAARPGTEKVKAALRQKSVKVVNPDWLWTCADRWEWVDERLYPLNDETAARFLLRDSPDPGANPRKKGTSNNNGEKTSTSKVIDSNGLGGYSLVTLSKEDISGMDAEVEKILDEDSDSEDDNNEASGNVLQENELYGTEDNEYDAALRKRVLSSFCVGVKRKYEESSDDESLSGDYPKGWKNCSRKRRRATEDADKLVEAQEGNGDDDENDFEVKSDDSQSVNSSSSGSADEDYKESVGSVDEEIAAAVEKELLS